MNEHNHSQPSARLIVASMATGVLLIGISAYNNVPTKLVWNASPSLPIGLYSIRKGTPSRGDLVLVRLPDWAALIADQYRYLPRNIPALKRVSALAGDRVCRFGGTVIINGTASAKARLFDNLGRRMPQWCGCVTLEMKQVFLLADHPKSFDGRYFGVTKLVDVLGVAEPVWARSE